MDIFGIGILEAFFIILLAMIVLGPKDMVKTGRSIGRFLRKLLLTPGFMEAQRWVRNFPAQLMREAGIEEIQRDLQAETEKIKEATTISLEDDQPVVTAANTSSPALTPFQATGTQTETMVKEEAETRPSPRIEARPDLPPEWVGMPVERAPGIRREPPEEFPAEWISPPKPVSPTYPPPIAQVVSADPSDHQEEKTVQD
jgi:Sec-independent protein translocase protein TatA